jgi:hypothetical protein
VDSGDANIWFFVSDCRQQWGNPAGILHPSQRFCGRTAYGFGFVAQLSEQRIHGGFALECCCLSLTERNFEHRLLLVVSRHPTQAPQRQSRGATGFAGRIAQGRNQMADEPAIAEGSESGSRRRADLRTRIAQERSYQLRRPLVLEVRHKLYGRGAHMRVLIPKAGYNGLESLIVVHRVGTVFDSFAAYRWIF